MARRKHTLPPPAPPPIAARGEDARPANDAAFAIVEPTLTTTPSAPHPHGGPRPEPPPRRRFVVRLWAVLGAAAFAELTWITGAFLRPRQPKASATGLFAAGPIGAFEPGSVTAFPSGRFYLVRLNNGGLMALHRECTHLGCTVPWDASKARFACPCHASAFDITGQVITPPAPRPLDYYAVRIENGYVKVDTRRRLQRTAFDASQVTVA